MQIQRLAILSLVPLSVASLSYSKPQQKHATKPYTVRLSLAGERLNLQKPFFKVLYDPKSNYYLIGDGFGPDHLTSLTLTLAPASKIAEYQGTIERRQIATLPHLKSGFGVNIGDSPAIVLRKLGQMPQQTGVDYESKKHTFWYRKSVWVTPPRKNKPEKWHYSAYYSFDKNRLWAIGYSIASPAEDKY